MVECFCKISKQEGLISFRLAEMLKIVKKKKEKKKRMTKNNKRKEKEEVCHSCVECSLHIERRGVYF